MIEPTLTNNFDLSSPILQITEKVKTAFLDLAFGIVDLMPNLITAFVILCIGLLLSKIIKSISTKVLKGIKIDTLAKKTGLHLALSKMGITGSLATLLPRILSFIITIFMVKQASESAGFTDVSTFIDTLLAFTPKLVTAFVIMVVGVFVGDLIRAAAFTTLDVKGLDYAKTVSKILFSLTIIVFLTVSLSQVGIETDLLKSTVKISLLGISAAIAIAMGLGLKEHATNIVAAVYVRDVYKKGTFLSIDDKNYTIMGTGPVTTKVQRDNGDFVIIPNHELVTQKTKGKVIPL